MSDKLPRKRAADQRQLQDVRLLRIYNYYRIVLSLVLAFTYLSDSNTKFIRLDHPDLFAVCTGLYALINIIMAAQLRDKYQVHPRQFVLTILIDITALTLLTYASGGVSQGLANLMIFSIAAGSIFLSGTYATAFAATASITIIGTEVYRQTIDQAVNQNYLQAGLLGIVLFATALFIKNISGRIHRSENLATQRATDIEHLEKLNRVIIQRMRTGIIVCSRSGQIRMMNDAARKLIENPESSLSQTIPELPHQLISRLKEWQKNPHHRGASFRAFPSKPEIQVNFTSFRQEEDLEILVFLEDISKTRQQAQQLKLASLGQLTASIAHEIRNPLGAISHSAQLLRESENLQQDDQRFLQIIDENSKRLNMTIENVLELSRRRPAVAETIELYDWLIDFANKFNESQVSPGKFDIEVNPTKLTIQIDPSQLSQIITNLSTNGLRYSEEFSGAATLRFEAGISPENDQPYLDVIDQGKGIADEVAQHLFEPFYTTSGKGTGLGLYISRELCEANRCRLDYRTHHSGGACFRIYFPHPGQILT